MIFLWGVDVNNLAKNLNRLNQENNLTIKEVANKLLVNPRTLQNYYNGTREPRIDMLIELAKFYRVTLDELIL